MLSGDPSLQPCWLLRVPADAPGRPDTLVPRPPPSGNRHSEPNPGPKVEGSEQALNASVLSSHGPTLPVPDRASSL